jgi:hypothetical protein
VTGRLSAARIIAEGETAAGIADPETHLHRNLEALVDSLNDTARLSPQGLATTHDGLVRVVRDRLESIKWLRDFPEIADEEIEDPVFLCGLPRSGTTYFQYLFENDHRFRLIRTWESITPFPPPGHDPASVERRKAEERAANEKLRINVPGFDALHLIDEDGPQECHLYLEYGFGAAGYHNMHDVPAYFDYLMDGLDLVPVYQVHKRLLQTLQWKCPRPRWALKYPNHVIAMDAVRKVHPAARFIMTHRDPVQVVASIAKMTWSLRNVRQQGGADAHRVGAQMVHFIRRHIDRIPPPCWTRSTRVFAPIRPLTCAPPSPPGAKPIRKAHAAKTAIRSDSTGWMQTPSASSFPTIQTCSTSPPKPREQPGIPPERNGPWPTTTVPSSS